MPEKILVADDDADNRRIMELTLRRAGYDVLLAADGEQALAAAVAGRPALILLDLSMPVLSGWDVLLRLREKEELVEVPVLAFTAHAMAGDEKRVMEAGFDGYLSKPCLPARAIEVVAAGLRARTRRP